MLQEASQSELRAARSELPTAFPPKTVGFPAHASRECGRGREEERSEVERGVKREAEI
jgi:hypothetical protein